MVLLLKDIEEYGNLETLKNSEINWEVELVLISMGKKVLVISYHKID